MTGHGRLRHHFWGTYHATIAPVFDTQAQAQAAQQAFPMFTLADTSPAGKGALRFHGTGQALKGAEAALRAAGADMKLVGSIARSIDWGEPFTVDVVIPDGSVQQPLFPEAQ